MPAMQGWDGAGALGIRTAAEGGQAVGSVAAAMVREDYPERDRFGLRLALEEALVNALRHGNRGDTFGRGAVRWRVTPDCCLAEVEDEGDGFDPAAVPDPPGAGEPGAALRPRPAPDAPLPGRGALPRPGQPRDPRQAPLAGVARPRIARPACRAAAFPFFSWGPRLPEQAASPGGGSIRPTA
jgi:anti-sigma regulatory factor (Ser/Thr protein kinase)